MDNFIEWKPRTVVFGSSGSMIAMVLGFLAAVEDGSLLTKVDTFCGVSTGSLIALLLVLGYETREIISKISQLQIIEDLSKIDFKSILTGKGLFSIQPMRVELEKLVTEKLGVIPSLHGLYLSTGKALITVSLNANEGSTVFFGPFTSPNLSCVEAVILSMNIPVLFYQLQYLNKTYMDGTLAHPYPVDYFDDGEHNILGISVEPENTLTLNNFNFLEYVTQLASLVFSQRRNQIIQESSENCRHVILVTKEYSPLLKSLSTEEKVELLVKGFHQGRDFLEKNSNNLYTGPPGSKINYNYPKYYLEFST